MRVMRLGDVVAGSQVRGTFSCFVPEQILVTVDGGTCGGHIWIIWHSLYGMRFGLESPDLEVEVVESKTPDNPDHYSVGGIETIDYIRAKLTHAEYLGYCKGNVLKYLSRAGRKGDADEDLRKAKRYIEFALENKSK